MAIIGLRNNYQDRGWHTYRTSTIGLATLTLLQIVQKLSDWLKCIGQKIENFYSFFTNFSPFWRHFGKFPRKLMSCWCAFVLLQSLLMLILLLESLLLLVLPTIANFWLWGLAAVAGDPVERCYTTFTLLLQASLLFLALPLCWWSCCCFHSCCCLILASSF